MSAKVAYLRSVTPDRPERRQAVYLIRLNGLHKIGISFNPVSRVKGMQLPGKAEIVHTVYPRDARHLESCLHERFAEERRHGEWFELTEADVRDAITVMNVRVEAEQQVTE